MVGATTLNEYRMNIEKDGALARRFQTVRVASLNNMERLSMRTHPVHTIVMSQNEQLPRFSQSVC